MHLRFPFLDPSGKLSPELAELFNLTTTEILNVQNSIEAAQKRLTETAKVNSTISRSEDGSITITTAPFLETGNVIYETLIKHITQSIGEQRSTALMQLTGDKMERSFRYFGAEERTVKVSKVPNQSEEGYDITVIENLSWGNESHGSSNSNYTNMESLFKNNRSIADLLPKDF